jgi:WD40 repeat protein
VYAVAFNGTTVAAASADHTIHLWNLAAQAGPETIPIDDSVFGLAFSPDGTALAAAGADDTIRIWRLHGRTYALRSVLLGHLALVRSVAFSPDGTTLVSGGSDDSVSLWDIATGQEVGSPFTVDTKSVQSVAYSPNGHFFVSGSLDGALRQWDAVTSPSTFAALSRQVCAFVGGGLNRTEWKAYAPNIPYRKTCSQSTPGP